jgi:hypothetical protein
MNDTEQLFLMAVIWAVIAAVIARFIPNWPGRIAFFSIAMAIPFWEFPYGYYNFETLCREQAMPQFFEKIPPQESICVENLDAGFYRGLVQAGFKKIEVRGGADDPQRYLASGRVLLTGLDGAKSPYCFSFKSNIRLPWRIWRHDQLVSHAIDGRIVARQSRFSWAGMWWQEDARPVLGRGGDCSSGFGRMLMAIRNGAG